MASALSVDEIVGAIQQMSEDDRGELVQRLIQMDDFIEDLEDVISVIRSANDPGRPFEEFMVELAAERRAPMATTGVEGTIRPI